MHFFERYITLSFIKKIHISPFPPQVAQSHPYNEFWMDWGPERLRT